MSTTVTATGRLLDLRNPMRQAIDIRDIAQGLAQRNLYAGAAVRPISYAEHALFMSESASRDFKLDAFGQLAALLFHAGRAYTEGLHGPVAQLVGLHLWEVERRVQAAVLKRFNATIATGSVYNELKLVHLSISAAEVRDLLPPHPDAWPELGGVKPPEWLTMEARELFTWRDWMHAYLDRFAALTFAIQQVAAAYIEEREQ